MLTENVILDFERTQDPRYDYVLEVETQKQASLSLFSLTRKEASWKILSRVHSHRSLCQERLARRWANAVALLENSVDTHPQRLSGVPCLKGTRVSVAQIIAQISEGDSIEDLVEDMELDRDTVVAFLDGLSMVLNRPAT